MLVMNLAVSDLLLMICMIPECAFNFFTGGPWRFGEMACLIHSFTGTSTDFIPFIFVNLFRIMKLLEFDLLYLIQ